MTEWSAQNVEMLKGMIAAGHRYTIIADALGMSKNAVIGKAHRLAARQRPTSAITPARPARTNEAPPSLRMPVPLPVTVAPVAKPAEKPPVGGVGFWSLKHHHCRRPLWADNARPTVDEQRYCGARTAPESSWCPACSERLMGVGSDRFIRSALYTARRAR